MTPWVVAAAIAAATLGACVGFLAWCIRTAAAADDVNDVLFDADLRALLATPRPAVEVAPLNDAEQAALARIELDFRRTTP